jgi:hypothetical protein
MSGFRTAGGVPQGPGDRNFPPSQIRRILRVPGDLMAQIHPLAGSPDIAESRASICSGIAVIDGGPRRDPNGSGSK